MPTKPGSVLIKGKTKWHPFTEFRQIIKGRNRGKVEVVLPPVPERRVIVEPWEISKYPVREKEPETTEEKEEENGQKI